MSNRYGRQHAALPYCLRTLSENRPRDYHEFMVRKRMLPEHLEVYMDDHQRFLYDTKPLGQELEELKASKRSSLDFIKRQTQQIKSLLSDKPDKPEVDIIRMKNRLMRAHLEHAMAAAAGDGRKSSEKGTITSSTSGPSKNDSSDLDAK